MARLRKPVSPTESSFIDLPTTTQRSSPHKLAPESSSTPARQLRYTWQDKPEETFLVPKIPASLALNANTSSTISSPRKQRILRPVASNSRLLRKLSNESLATPDRKERLRPANAKSGLSYARSLARTVAKRQGDFGGRIEGSFVETTTVVDGDMGEVEVEEEDLELSTFCGEEGEGDTVEIEQIIEEEVLVREEEEEHINSETDGSDEDEDDIVDVRHRRTQTTRRRVVESDSEPEEEDDLAAQLQNIRLENAGSESDSQPEKATVLPPKKSTPQKSNSSISNWAQEVVNLTDSPDVPLYPVLPSQTTSEHTSFTSTTRPTSSYSDDGPGIIQ